MENDYTVLLIIMFIMHWVGDFVFQTRKIADNKSKSIKYLTQHVFLYMCTFTPMVFAIGFGTEFLWFIFLLFSTHWITDFITSKFTRYFWRKKNIRAFFTTVGFDQLIHAVTLFWLAHKFMGLP